MIRWVVMCRCGHPRGYHWADSKDCSWKACECSKYKRKVYFFRRLLGG